MARAPKFYSLLPQPRDVAVNRLEAYARDPSRTVDQVFDFLQSEFGILDAAELPNHPMAVWRSAVGRWKKNFDLLDRMSAAAELADAVYTSHAESGTIDLVRANNLLSAQLLQKRLADGEALDTKELCLLIDATNRNATAKQREDKIDEYHRTRQIAAVREAEAAEKTGKSAADVIGVMKVALGITA